MSNALFKSRLTTYNPGALASPGQLASPARSAYADVLVCGFEYDPLPAGWVYQTVANASGGIRSPVYVGSSSPPPSLTPGPYNCITQSVLVDFPATPYVAPTAGSAPSTSVDFRFGWNAGARSIVSARRSARFDIEIPAGLIGAIVAFEDTGRAAGAATGWTSSVLPFQPIDSPGYLYTYLKDGVYVHNGVAYVWDGGISTYLGAAAAGDKFTVKRGPYSTLVYQNDVLGVTITYTTESGTPRPTNVVTMLYAGGDQVFDPVLTALSDGVLPLQPLGVFAGEGAAGDAGASLVMEKLVYLQGAGASLRTQALQLMGANYAYDGAALVLEPLTALGFHTAGPVPTYAVAALELVPFVIAAQAVPRQGGGGALTLEKLSLLGTNFPSYGTAVMTFPYLQIAANAYEGKNAASMSNALVASTSLEPSALIAVVMNSAGTITSTFAVQFVSDAAMSSALTGSTVLSADAIIAAVMNSVMTLRTAAPPLDGDNQVWVLNWDSQASTSYEQYPFNSFAVIDGEYFGVKDDGLFHLEGDTDDGDDIRASINFGKQNFGTKAQKRVPNAYLGVSSTGVLVMKVTVDGTEHLYTARSSDENMSVQRVDIGKGIKANYMTFELYNQDGCDFELDEIEFHYVETTRRI